MSDQLLETTWNSQSVWSQTADRLKADLSRRRNWALGLSIAGAVLANAAVIAGLESVVGKALAGLGAFAVAAGGLVKPRGGAVQSWTRARSVAEGIKSEVYRYLTGSDAYGEGDRDARLRDEIAVLERRADDLLRYATGIQPKRRDPPKARDADAYDAERVQSQIKWYGGKAKGLRKRVDRFSRAQIAIGLLGAAIAALAGATEVESVAIWVPVVTTVAAAVTAYAAAERYEFLLLEYGRTAAELKRLSASSRADADYVKRCEDVISAQNEGWMAKFAGPPEAPA